MSTTIRLIYITTAAGSANGFLRGQLAYMREKGFDITVISAPGDELRILSEREKVTTVAVPMEREMHPLKDLTSLLRLYKILKRLRPAIVNASTPKAGLLGMIAACAAGVPVRIYTLRGLRLETARGPKHFVLGAAERCASAFAHRVICVSHTLRDLYVTLGFTTAAKARVLGRGSSNGVNVDRFTPTPQMRDSTRALRARSGIPDGVPVIGFAGRFTRDKGVPELLDAFDRVLAAVPNAWLMMLGDFEAGDSVPESYAERLRRHPRVVISGFVPNPACYYPIMDILALPSYREGFPTVPLEAAAAEVPTVAFTATGSADAVCDGVTGTLVPLGDVNALACALQRYLNDDDLRRRHGQAARERAVRDFRPEMLWKLIYEEYVQLMKAKDGGLLEKLVSPLDDGSPRHSTALH